MKKHCRSKLVLVTLLSISLLATGCSAQWISVALADLPVLVQMSLNIGTLVTTLETGRQLSSAEAGTIQDISKEASKDLALLQVLYNQYKASPTATTIQKIQSAIADLNQNLPKLLQAAHISDPTLSTRITAAVNLILTTVNSFASLIPQPAPSVHAQVARQKLAVPVAAELKKQWNEQVCGTIGTTSLASCTVN